MANKILVIAEHIKGEITEITYEMLGAGRKVADALNAQLNAVVFGENTAKLGTTLGCADVVLSIENPQLEMPSADTAAVVIKNIIKQNEISLVLVGGTNVSQGIGAELSALTNLPFVNFCTNIKCENDKITFTSQLFGGKIHSEVNFTDNMGIVSIYPGSFTAEAGQNGNVPAVENSDIPFEEPKIKFKGFIEAEESDVDITNQNVLVAVGRGFQSEDDIEIATELADALNGAVCGSRPVIDQDWLPLNRQVGKSGMIVKPRLYFAAGISGAPEHVEGMQNSDLIISVNTDPEAPIFNFSHYGICQDLNDIIPPLIKEIKSRKGA